MCWFETIFRFIIIQPIFCFALLKLHSQNGRKNLTHKIFNAALFSISTFKSLLARTCKFARSYLIYMLRMFQYHRQSHGHRSKSQSQGQEMRWMTPRHPVPVTSLQPVTRLVTKFRNSLRYVIACPQNLYIFVLPVFRPVIPVFSELGDYAMEPSTEISNFIVGAYNQTRPGNFRASGRQLFSHLLPVGSFSVFKYIVHHNLVVCPFRSQ